MDLHRANLWCKNPRAEPKRELAGKFTPVPRLATAVSTLRSHPCHRVFWFRHKIHLTRSLLLCDPFGLWLSVSTLNRVSIGWTLLLQYLRNIFRQENWVQKILKWMKNTVKVSTFQNFAMFFWSNCFWHFISSEKDSQCSHWYCTRNH